MTLQPVLVQALDWVPTALLLLVGTLNRPSPSNVWSRLTLASDPMNAYFPPRSTTGEQRMNLQKTYAALLTADLAAAESWYTKLLGRGPDYRPMDTLVQWELFDHGGVMLSTSDEIAGRGAIFLYVNDIAAERRRLQSVGIVLEDDIPGDYSTLAQVRDPDGNLLMLATPPVRPFPPA